MFRFSGDHVPFRVENVSRCATYSKSGLRICPTMPFFLETSRKKICHDANLEVDREFLFNEEKKKQHYALNSELRCVPAACSNVTATYVLTGTVYIISDAFR